MSKFVLIIVVFSLSWIVCPAQSVIIRYQSPLEQYGRLFIDVMDADSLFGKERLFVESKTFVDAVPRRNVNDILADYCRWNGKSMEKFLKQNFIIPSSKEKTFAEKIDVDTYIKTLWTYLTLPADTMEKGTRILMHHPYFVPGGRFREMYYWDSYFSMLGMLADNEKDIVLSMLENFADCIRQLGFIPNGMRTYYLGRSQPPFFSFMVEDAASEYGDSLLTRYLPEMEAEYKYWMRGRDKLSGTCRSSHHVVMMPEGEVLNRYYDEYDIPREEAWRNDIETSRLAEKNNTNIDTKVLFRNLRAAAESGFDFSSRWFADGWHLYTIRTTDIVPVDLNSLLHHLEKTLAKGYEMKGDKQRTADYNTAAEKRKRAIEKYMWSKKEGFFTDFILSEKKQSPQLSLAGVYPLFSNIATESQAESVESVLARKFLKKGGLTTTLNRTGEQWDAPNGWAPLQWIAFKGLRNYGLDDTANNIRERWLATCRKVYDKTGKMLEKYNVELQDQTGGGEYENQTGFGWTNGVYRAMEIER